MPHIPVFTLPKEEFDCMVYIQEKAVELITEKGNKTFRNTRLKYKRCMQSMMKMVMKEERIKPPFVHAKKETKLIKMQDLKTI